MKTVRALITTFLIFTAVMSAQSQNKNLVVYYSWSGNTKVIAEYIQVLTGADIVRIEPVDKYPADYKTCCDRAKKEINANFKPEIKATVENLNRYDTIFVGTPNWWSTMAPPIATFLTSFNFKGKTVIPFCSHGGGGEGHIFFDMVSLCPGIETKKGFSVEGHAVRESNRKVEEWINSIKNKK